MLGMTQNLILKVKIIEYCELIVTPKLEYITEWIFTFSLSLMEFWRPLFLSRLMLIEIDMTHAKHSMEKDNGL